MRWLDQADFRERREDDTRRGAKLGIGDLDHGGVAIAKLEYPAPRPSGRIVDRLDQLDNVESGNPVRHGHCHMLGARIGGHQSWRGIGRCVVPAHPDCRAAVADYQDGPDATNNAEG